MKKGQKRNLKELSAKQQVGLYVVLTKLYDDKNKPFFSSDFAKAMRKFLIIKDEAEYRKTIGGILGALSKNNILEKVSADRDPLWKLPTDIHAKPVYYKKELQHVPQVVTRWKE
jgi:hypothetical protein